MVKQLRALMAMLLLCLSVLTVGAMAQTSTTGSIEGNITDVNGASVPGVTVSVTSPNLIRPQTAVSNEEGRYRVPNLPPGQYDVVVESVKGFGRYETSKVAVNLSKVSSVDIQLQPAGASATVEVSATSGATIDVTSNTTGTNVSTEQFSNFPTSRTIQGLYTIAPSVARSGLRDASGRDRDPSVSGSSGPENNYILDGVNVSDPAFGGSGANLPFEFVQEVEIKTGAFSAEYGKATGGIFNVITKSGGNNFHGDLFGYFSGKSFVRKTTSFPLTGSAPNGFSESDIGGDINGPIIKDKLTFFAAFNPQFRKNYLFTQTFRQNVQNKIKTPFYAGKLTYAVNQNNTITFSTFGDYSTQKGFLGGSGFGANVAESFNGKIERGGSNYTARLNSTITPTFIAEIAGGLHLQRLNTIPAADLNIPFVSDSFAILSSNKTVVTPTTTNISDARGLISYVNSPGGTLQRGFARQGFGLFSNQKRDRSEFTARFQNLLGKSTVKYGFEYNRNKYNLNTISTGPKTTFANPLELNLTGGPDNNTVSGYRVTNNFSVCTTRGNQIVCPSATAFRRARLIATSAGYAGGAVLGSITATEVNTNPFLILTSTRVRDFKNIAKTRSDVESFYIQEEYKAARNVQFTLGGRWDYQQSYGNGNESYLKLNNWWDNFQPRIGVSWDFTGTGRGKLFANYARFVEAPIPLDVNVRAGSQNSQTDKNFNVNQLNAPIGSTIVPGIRAAATTGAVNLGADPTPIDAGLKPQTVNDLTAGIEFGLSRDLSVSARGIYRSQGSVIEDGSFDDGDNYFLFNPGEKRPGSTEDLACSNPDVGCFGRARRYYRALEFSATKRFSNNYQFVTSYVYSSLIGNYEGLFRNDNGQADPNITSLFDLVSLLTNQYGRMPNDRPHQFKFNGSYQTPFKLMLSGNFYAQSGIPFNQLIPHPVYGNNEGFAVQRGTAINPVTGKNRSPFTTNLDLGAYYPIVFGENRQLRFQADWFNVFNSQRAITQDQTFSINSGVTGVPPVNNPFYGTGTIFQFPSALRLGVKLQF